MLQHHSRRLIQFIEIVIDNNRISRVHQHWIITAAAASDATFRLHFHSHITLPLLSRYRISHTLCALYENVSLKNLNPLMMSSTSYVCRLIMHIIYHHKIEDAERIFSEKKASNKMSRERDNAMRGWAAARGWRCSAIYVRKHTITHNERGRKSDL